MRSQLLQPRQKLRRDLLLYILVTLHTPGVVVYQHGPFAWGKDAHDAVHNAVVMEEVARMAWIARAINPQLKPIDSWLMDKHFMRKHGPNAYYGQK